MHYFHNYFIKDHIKCKKCMYWQCARCQLERDDCKSIITSAIKREEIVKASFRVTPDLPIPEYGVCIKI